jgi:cell division protein FtsB
MSEDKTDKHTFPRFWLFVILILGSVILGDLNQRMADARGLENDLTYLVDKNQQLDNEIQYLDEQLEYVKTDDFIDDWAHQEARMVKDGEVLVIFVPDGVSEDTDTPATNPENGQSDQLKVWLELIFGP